MAALTPSLVRVLECMRRVFDRPRYGLRTYDFDVDDRMFLRGSGSFKFSAHPTLPRQGFVRIVGNSGNVGFRIEVCADFFGEGDGHPKKSFGPTFMRQHYGKSRRELRSPKIRKFATYALMRLRMHFNQLVVNEIHDL